MKLFCVVTRKEGPSQYVDGNLTIKATDYTNYYLANSFGEIFAEVAGSELVAINEIADSVKILSQL